MANPFIAEQAREGIINLQQLFGVRDQGDRKSTIFPLGDPGNFPSPEEVALSFGTRSIGGRFPFKNMFQRLKRTGKLSKFGSKLLKGKVTEFQKADPLTKLNVPFRAQQNIREADPLTGVPTQQTPADRRFNTGGRFQNERDEFLGSGKDIIQPAQAVGGFPKSETGTESMQKGAATFEQVLRKKSIGEISGADILNTVRNLSSSKADALARVGSMRRLLETTIESQEDLRFQGKENRAELVGRARFSNQLAGIEQSIEQAPASIFGGSQKSTGTGIAEILGGEAGVQDALTRLEKRGFKSTIINPEGEDLTSGFVLRSEDISANFNQRRIQGKEIIVVDVTDGRGESIGQQKLGEFETFDAALSAFEGFLSG